MTGLILKKTGWYKCTCGGSIPGCGAVKYLFGISLRCEEDGSYKFLLGKCPVCITGHFMSDPPIEMPPEFKPTLEQLNWHREA